METPGGKDGEPFYSNSSMPNNETPTTCSFDEGVSRYTVAKRTLESICERLSKCKPPPMFLPDIDDICYGNYAVNAPRLPDEFSMNYLTHNINTIAGTLQWTAQPDRKDVHPTHNHAIWLYNSDIGHSFSHRVFNIRYNVIVMIFLWALHQAGEDEVDKPWTNLINPHDDQGRKVYTFWTLFIQAWLESLRADGNFTKRSEFLRLWDESEFDLVMFTRSNIKRLDKAIKQFTSSIPAYPAGDPLQFLEKLSSGDTFQMEEIRQHCPAYAWYFCKASEQEAKELDMKLAQAASRVEEEKAEMQEYERTVARTERCKIGPAHARTADDQEMDVDEDEEMADDEELPMMDLSRVKWDEEPLAGLLSVQPETDIGVLLAKNELPPRSRKEWIDQETAIHLLWNKMDSITDIMNKLTIG